MRDLLIITPTRGRPDSARRLISAVAATATAQTDLIIAVDDDDPSYDDFSPLPPGVTLVRGPRAICIGWTNRIAAEYGPRYRALASLGDDHVPLTPGWDTALLNAIDSMGGTGIAYGDDTLQGKWLPTAPVMSSSIVAALGWMMYPPLVHFFADNVWLDLGREAGCLRYVPEVVIQHLHYTAGRSPRDATYIDAEPAWAHDEPAYHAWRAGQMAADVATVRSLMG